MVSRCSPDAPRRSAGSARRRSCAAGRAGPGFCGMVDAGAAGAGSPVGPPAAQDAQSAAGAQDCIQRRHRRDRAAGAKQGAWVTLAAGELSLEAIARAEALLAVPGGAEGFAAGSAGRCLYAAGMIRVSHDQCEAPLPNGSDGIDQDQFLTILSREDALARFEAALFPRAVPSEQRPLAEALGCALAEDVAGADRRAAVRPLQCRRLCRALGRSRFGRRNAAVRLMLNDEVIACGTAPTRPVLSGTATPIATGGPVPRGADAIVMVEHTQPAGSRAIEIRRAASPGQFVSYAGSDIARGEALLRAGTVIGSREIGMLAACGIARSVRGAPAARRCHLDRRRTGAARRAAAPRRDLRHQRRDRHRGDLGEWRRGGFLGAIPDDEARLKPRCAARSKPATCWCCPAAPRRARATSPTASSLGSASPASSPMVSR